ncbi:MAG: FecR family protein [Chitinophagaceae bacterium]|nr:FecR family protein [Chitinophagaceae bacterium]
MLNRPLYISELIEKKWKDQLTAEEDAALEQWARESPENRALLEQAMNEEWAARELNRFAQYDSLKSRRRLALYIQEKMSSSQIDGLSPGSARPDNEFSAETILAADYDDGQAKVVHSVHFMRTSWFRYSAAVVLLLGIGAYIWNIKPDKAAAPMADTPALPAVQDDAPPGSDKAILTLADGSSIALDSASSGQLAVQGNTQVLKLADGQLRYNVSGNAGDKPMYNTMRTPRGGQYKLTLPDGTRVWLNSASSITYPAVFIENERTVSITGEAYFEVAKITDPVTHKAARPFKVEANGMTVEVLGTYFNINAYGDETDIKTTLLEGSVKIWHGGLSGILKPGEQSQVNDQLGIKILKNANLEETMAWKNGLFYFSNANIQTVMRQLARWYDVEVVYSGKIPVREFQGEIQKNLNLAQVLNILGKMEVNFQLEGKKLIVMQ